MDCEMAPSGNEVGVWRYRLSGCVWPLAGICLTRTATKVLPCQRRCLLRGPPVARAGVGRAALAAGSKVRDDGVADPVVVFHQRAPGRGVGRGTERRTWPLRAPQCAPCCQVSAPLTITASMPTAGCAGAS